MQKEMSFTAVCLGNVMIAVTVGERVSSHRDKYDIQAK